MKNVLNWLIVIALLSIMSCTEDESNTPEDTDHDHTVDVSELELYGEVVISGNTIAMYGEEVELTTGYNTLYFTVKDAEGEYSTETDLNADFLMKMTEMSHACPAEEMEEHEGLYSKNLVFVMPSNESELWEVSFSIDGIDTVAKIEFDVVESTNLQKLMSNGIMYFVSLVDFDNPETGMNDIEFTVHSKESMMSWPAQDDITIVMTPYMPGMGHGSPNNVNPVHAQNGHYKGEVNFTMTGDWTVTLDLSNSSNTIGQVVFPISF